MSAALPAMSAAGVILVPYGTEHDKKTVTWLNDPELRRSFGITSPVTEASHRAWIEKNPQIWIWAIFDQDQNYCGNILVHSERRHASGYLQIYLGDSLSRGKGVGYVALSLVLDYVFHKAGLHRIWLHTLPGALGAEALYRKAGFVEEGLERECIRVDHEFRSQRRWSLLSREWQGGEKNTCDVP